MADNDKDKPAHTLTDHLYGRDAVHRHGDHSDHDHDFDLRARFRLRTAATFFICTERSSENLRESDDTMTRLLDELLKG